MRQNSQGLVTRVATVEAVKAREIDAALLVDKAPQISLPFGIGPAGGQQLAAVVLADVVADDITQNANKNIVH
jgi:hypothetical protein